MEYSQIGLADEKTEIDCRKLLDKVLNDLITQIEATEAEINIGALPTLTGYRPEIYLLFQNLVENGLKFQKADHTPRLHVAGESRNDHWEFRISDKGIGIHPEYHEQIFGIFQRLHKKGTYDGDGIGLAFCKKIEEIHGGKIWLESVPNTGSTFYFTIPH